MFARFPFGACDHPDTSDWLVSTVLKAKADPRISDLFHWRIDDTPITMGRNRCIQIAKDARADLLLMLDSDMSPDLPEPGGKPFWDTSFEFIYRHYDRGPSVVAAPYCGPPPHENCYVFRWASIQSDHPDADMRLEQFTREEAAIRGGFEKVAALPTGLFLLDMRAIERLTPPYFYYEWTDQFEQAKASTEDVTFTRDLSLAGVPLYVNWDAWAGHWKRKRVGKPKLITAEQVGKQFREAVLRNHHYGDRLVMVGDDKK
jgi:hypothetical protein